MKRTQFPMTAFMTVFLACVAPTIAAPLADRLPGNAAIYIEWAGYDELKTAEGETPFGKIVERPAVKRFISELTRIITLNARKEAAAEGEAETLDRALELADILWHHRVAIDVLGVTMSDRGPAPEAVLAIDFAGDTESANEFRTGIEKILEKVGLPPATQEEIDGRSLKTIVIPFISIVRYGIVDDVFLVMLGTDTPAKVFAALNGNGPVVSKDRRFVAAMKKIGTQNRRNIMISHLDTATILEQARDVWKMMTQSETFPPMIENALNAASFDRLHSVTTTIQVDRDRFRQSMFIALPPNNGLPKWMHQKPVSDEQLRMVPFDAVFAKIANFRLTDIYDGIAHVVSAIGPDQNGQFKNGIAKVEGQIGLRIRDDILAKFDGGWIAYVSPSAGGIAVTGLTLMIESSDTDGIEQIVTRLVRMIDTEIPDVSIAIQEQQYKGHTVRHLAFKGQPIPVAPAWTTHDGYLILALYPQIVTHAVDHLLTGDAARSITDNPDFQNGLKRLPKNPTTIVYTDTKALAGNLYSLLLPLSTMAAAQLGAEGIDISPGLLPGRNDLTADLFGDVATYSSDKDGVLIVSTGPFPIEMAAVAVPFAMGATASILIPSLSRARTLAKRTVSMANVRGLLMACHIYANDHNDQFPPSLESLIDEGSVVKKMLRSPLETRNRNSYVYLAAGSQNIPDPGQTVVIYEHPENHGNEGTVVGFADGHAEFVPIPRFNELLAKSRETLKKGNNP